MRVFLDANVLYPTVLRGMLLDFAKLGAFNPLWSDRVIEEWRRAAIRNNETGADIEIALMKSDWPDALVSDQAISGVTLPDDDDVHVIDSALAGNADEILTANTSDFPSKTLTQLGLIRRHPDEFLLELYNAHQNEAGRIFEAARKKAQVKSGKQIELDGLLKRMRLMRLRKAIRG